MCKPSDDLNDIEKDGAQMPRNRSKPRIYMDDALAQTNFGFVNYLVLFVTALIITVVFMDTCGISYVLPVTGCDFYITPQQKGLLGGIGLFGVICSSHLWGFLADTYGRKRIIHPTLILAFTASFASTLVSNFYLLTLLRFVNGIFISGSSATIYAYLGEMHDTNRRSRALMMSVVIVGILCVLFPFVALFVINQDWQFEIPVVDVLYKPWRLFLVICSLPGMVAWVIFFFLPESPKFVLGQGDQEGAIAIVAEINRRNNGKNAVLDITEICEESESIENRQRLLNCQKSRFPFFKSLWIQTVPLFKPPYLKTTLILTTLQFCIYYVCNGVFIFVSEILNRIVNNVDNFYDDRLYMCEAINSNVTKAVSLVQEDICVSKLEVETIELAFTLECIYACGFLVIGVIITYVTKKTLIFSVLIVSSMSAIAAMQVNVPAIQIGFFLAFMCTGIVSNVTNAIMIDIYPTAMRAMAVSMLMVAGRFGAVVGSNVSSILLDSYCEYTFYVPGCLFGAAAFLVYLIPYQENQANKAKPRRTIDPRASVISYR